MIRTIEKRVHVFHNVEVCTGAFGAAPYRMPSLSLYMYQTHSFLHLTICKCNSLPRLGRYLWHGVFLTPNWYL